MNNVKTIIDKDRPEGYIKKVSTSLGIGTNGVFGWTIGIPSTFMVRVSVHHKRLKLRWEFLTPSQQFAYYRDVYLPLVVKFHCMKAIGVVELTRAGNMHLHLLCQCDTMVNDYDMWATRKALLQNIRVLEIARGSPKRGCHLNYIHFLTNVDEWLTYMGKDLTKHEFPIFTIS